MAETSQSHESKRREELKAFYRALNTDDGQRMMKELRSAWSTFNPLDANVQTMGFNIGLQQAFRQLEAWQLGEGINDE